MRCKVKTAVFFTLILFGVLLSDNSPAQSLVVKKKRPPLLDVSAYQRIAVGDIVGSSGVRTERAMDLADELTSLLFNAHTLEVIDRNALSELLSSDRGSDIKTINEQTTSALSKKLNSAIIIVGRIQNEKVYTEEKSIKNIIHSTGCSYGYWWHLSGDITVQIKILDVKTGKMIFSNPIVKAIDINTKQECERRVLGDIEPLLKEKLKELARDIANMVIPYEEEVVLQFQKPLITIFKNPFKKLNQAAAYFAAGDVTSSLAILKAYADDKTLKPNLQKMAAYNYGLGLFAAEQYDQATEQLKVAGSKGSLGAVTLMTKVEDEKQLIKRQEEMVLRAKALREAQEKQASEAPAAPVKAVKSKSKKTNKRSN